MTKHIAVGGTFDLFHKGHKDFLKKAFGLSDRITVGVTSDKLSQSLGKSPIDPFQTRLNNVRSYIKINSNKGAFTVLAIDDIFGTTIIDRSIDSIAVTKNTHDGALKINTKRVEKNLKPLKILVVPLLCGSDNKPISSTRIKNGEISTEGLNYLNLMTNLRTSKLPPDLRKRLSKPQGFLYRDVIEFIKSKNSLDKLISVGDQITHNLLLEGMIPKLSIVDLMVQRNQKFRSLKELGFPDSQKYVTAKNPAGNITLALAENIGKILKSESKSNVLIVEGEEDLAVIPAVLLSPLGFTVIYGQKDKGVVAINVDLQTKTKFLKLLNRFER